MNAQYEVHMDLAVLLFSAATVFKFLPFSKLNFGWLSCLASAIFGMYISYVMYENNPYGNFTVQQYKVAVYWLLCRLVISLSVQA